MVSNDIGVFERLGSYVATYTKNTYNICIGSIATIIFNETFIIMDL